MRDSRPNPDIWGNVITTVEIADGIYKIISDTKKGLQMPKAVAEEILPKSVISQAETDGENVYFTDSVSNAMAAETLLRENLSADPKAISALELLMQLENFEIDTGFEPPVSDMELENLELE